MILQKTNGYPEFILLAACEVGLFYKTADWFLNKLGIDFLNKKENGEGISWQFEFQSSLIVLRYDPQQGISLYPAALGLATSNDLDAFKMFTEKLNGL